VISVTRCCIPELYPPSTTDPREVRRSAHGRDGRVPYGRGAGGAAAHAPQRPDIIETVNEVRTMGRMVLVHGARSGGEVAAQGGSVATPGPLRAAYVLSALVVALIVASSMLGLFVNGLYEDGAWASQALRGGDLVSLVVAAPLLAFALAGTVRGSRRWPAVWIGLLGYSVYNYAFYVYGARFNDAFLLHIFAMSMSLFAIALGLPCLNWRAAGASLRLDRWAGWIGGVLIVVGVVQGAAWVFLIVRYVVTGKVLEQIPANGQHLIFALDLTLMMPALVIAGILLVRRTAIGYLLGTAVAVLGAVYSLNGNAAAWFQARAGVAGAQAVSPTNVVITLAMFVPALVLWFGPRERAEAESATLPR
jgi:hypothetical protein